MKENIHTIVIYCLLGYLIFLQQCNKSVLNSGATVPAIDTIIQIDTTPPPPIVINLPRQKIPRPVVVYVDSSKNIVTAPSIDTTAYQAAQLYKDSLEDENLTLYYSSLVDGQLLQNVMDYKLKVPTEITKTITINKPYAAAVNQVLLTGAVGTDFQGKLTTEVGFNFVHAKGWMVGYSYDIAQNTHNLKAGVRLFYFSSKKAKKPKDLLKDKAIQAIPKIIQR